MTRSPQEHHHHTHNDRHPHDHDHIPLAGDHDHAFLGDNHARNEKRTWLVIAITATMMVIEIVSGTLFGSMALLADGWHMSTHAAAMLIAALAYLYARRNVDNPRFTFGTGKVGDLAAFGSAVVLALVALLIGWESLVRLTSPVSINFSDAILVACIGLVVNVVCAWLLHEDHGHDHGHSHSHGHHHDHGKQDHNLRAAYLHVLADALTSVLAIVALSLGRLWGWSFLDPVMGIVGALVIARWSWTLIRDTGAILVDYNRIDNALEPEIRAIVEAEGAHVQDLHLWYLGPGHHAAIVSIVSEQPHPVAFYKEKLASLHGLSHLTIEVESA
ncbi:CDF family Co(II)/Ni(II) efflux transporter DmeF [Martelella mediterranea]|uniref:Cation diffusion facilitator family transporter n=1 Tax=Martelella mediterranea TaxID=293089 RepID=A0A4R3P1J1_9HYPH|nr:CDF family Co(II)/Ni(II) efflux transporter DmeF [Martelella mediterranea]TCT43119.1 cation diffusion facilitator family transporter [Martelella mediterranea]